MLLKYNNQLKLGFLSFMIAIPLAFAATDSAIIDTEETKNPLGCKSVGFKFEMTTLNLLPEESGEPQSLFFIYNQLDSPVQLYQMRDANRVDQLNLNHMILPHRWAVLSTSEKQLRYACAKKNINQQYGALIDCEKSLKICEYVRVKYGLNNRGDYWLVDGNTRGGAVQDVIRYGIIPR